MRSVKVGRVEYRIRCASYGREGHSTHVYAMRDRGSAEAAVELYDGRYRAPRCAPWVVEARAVSEYGDPDAAELCLYAVGRTLGGRLF